MLAGSALGGAIGQTASGFMGINKDGNLSLDPEEWDVNTIEQGLVSTVTSLASNANQAETKNKLSALTDNSASLFEYIGKNPDAATQIRFDIDMLIRNGSYEQLRNYIENLLGGGINAN